MGIGGCPHPADDLPKVIQDNAPLGAYDPAVIGYSQGTEEVRVASSTNRLNQLDTVAVYDAQQRRLSQKAVSPLSLRFEPPEQNVCVRATSETNWRNRGLSIGKTHARQRF